MSGTGTGNLPPAENSNQTQLNLTPPQQDSAISERNNHEAPLSNSLLHRIFNRSRDGNSSRVSSTDTISHTLSSTTQIEILDKAQTDILLLVPEIIKDSDSGAMQRLEQLVTTLAEKLRAGEIAKSGRLAKDPVPKAVRRLLAVLDPVVLRALSAKKRVSYTIPKELHQANGNRGRFGARCQQLLSREHRATALADIATAWDKYASKEHLGKGVASCLVDYFRQPDHARLVRPTAAQAYEIGHCLIDKVLRRSIAKILVDPNKTITFPSTYTMPPPYVAGPPSTEDAGKIPLPEYVLEALDNIGQTFAPNDARRDRLVASLKGISVPEHAKRCTISTWGDQDDCREDPPYPDTPVVPCADIQKFNGRLDSVAYNIRSTMDGLKRR